MNGVVHQFNARQSLGILRWWGRRLMPIGGIRQKNKCGKNKLEQLYWVWGWTRKKAPFFCHPHLVTFGISRNNSVTEEIT